MTLLEPAMFGTLFSYVMTPIAAYALGFDPSLSWQYLLAFGVLPIVFAIPAFLQLCIGWALFSGELVIFESRGDMAEKMGLLLIAALICIGTYYGVSNWVHAPATALDHLRLVVATPFIGCVATVLVLAAAALLVSGLTYPFRKTSEAEDSEASS
jgi:hypothetical protein